MLTIGLSLMLLFTGCRTQTPAHFESAAKPQEVKTKISKEQAIEVAGKHAVQTYDSLERFNIVACETARVWVIIYDGGGPEYVISKESGLVLGGKKIPQGPDVDVEEDSSSRGITGQEAIEIGRQQAHSDYGEAMSRYDVFACELAKAWRVSLAYREVPGELLPNSRSPLYVIDKRTGRVIYKEG